MEEDLKDEETEVFTPNTSGVGPLPRMILAREYGLLGRPSARRPVGFRPAGSNPQRALTADEVAEERLITQPRDYETLQCKLVGPTRSTFLMVFSPDKELLASTHGDHNIYITKVKTGECVQTLKGHPRTPWCVAFHPSHKDVLASGCLGGHVRVWDLDGGSELWQTDGVIASLAFHPIDRLLVIATFNELYFWDWSQPEPFTKVNTKNEKEKVRYVKFDSLGNKLITGIANLSTNSANGGTANAERGSAMRSATTGTSSTYGRLIMDRYERMMQRFNNTTPDPPPRTTDRGTDPMASTSSSSSAAASAASSSRGAASQRLSDLAIAASLNSEAAAALPDAEVPPPWVRDEPLPPPGPSENTIPLAEGIVFSRRANGSGTRMWHYVDWEDPPTPPDAESPRRRFHTRPHWVPSMLPRGRDGRSRTRGGETNRNITDFSYYRWELRERMRQLSSMRDMNRNGASSLDEIRPPPATEATPPPRPPARQRINVPFVRDRARAISRTFNHSPESSFIEVGTARSPERNVGGATEVFTNPERPQPVEANSRFQNIRERRLRELLNRREALVSQIEDLRSARELLFPGANGSDASPPTSVAASAVSSSSPSLSTTDPAFGSRPIDEWAVNRRLSLESSRLARSLSAESRWPFDYSPSNGNDYSDSRRNSGGRDYSSRVTEEADLDLPFLNESDAQMASASVVDSRVQAQPENPPTPLGAPDAPAASAPPPPAEEEEVPSTSSGVTDAARGDEHLTPAERERRRNMDIALLSRHIDHMQRICRQSLLDLGVARQRRQVVRLQSIRRMLEDLQQQIRSLRAASLEELNRRSREAETLMDGISPESRNTSTPEQRSEALAAVDQPTVSGADIRSGVNRLATRTLRSFARSNRRSGSTAAASTRRAPSTARSDAVRANRTRLSRAHNQLVSQLRATFRAMEMSPDLARSSNSPIGDSKAEASRNVMERTEQNATRPKMNESAARNELRALSQRLERMLRERRESGVSEDDPDPPPVPPLSDAGIPRPDPNPSGWRHFLDGYDALPGYVLDISSESDSDSDLTSHGDPLLSSAALPSEGAMTYSEYRRLRDTSTPAGYGQQPINFNSPGRPRMSGIFRDSLRERLDIRAGLRRDAERERQRLSRERDVYRRRRRYRYFGDVGARGDASSERLPPLRELIWRRLRRRNAQLDMLNDELGVEPRDRSRNRELLAWMVDQLTIDRNTVGHEDLDIPRSPPTSTAPPPPPPPPPRPSFYLNRPPDPVIRHRYVDRIRNQDGVGIPVLQRDNYFLPHTPSNLLTHRIQAWEFGKGDIPNISDSTENIVVKEAKIHNDASVDISEDGTILVSLVPSSMPMQTVVGVYSLETGNRGQCYATRSLESSAVSVSLSPTTKHLLVGLTSRSTGRISLSPADRNLIMAQIFRIQLPLGEEQRGRLIHRRDIDQKEQGHTALNCIRWIPVPGQGFVYATNTGLLKIRR